jgi:hypothetical protein
VGIEVQLIENKYWNGEKSIAFAIVKYKWRIREGNSEGESEYGINIE